jgi:hypothetical protein
MTYFEPSRAGTTVFAPTTGKIIQNDSHTIKIESDIVSGLVIELTHVKTGGSVITGGNLQTTYYDETGPLGEDFPHLHLTVNYNGQDYDPWPFLPLEFSAGNFYYESESSPGSYYHSGNGNIEDLPKIPGTGAQFP